MSEPRLRDPEPPEPRYTCRECGVLLGEDDGDYCPDCLPPPLYVPGAQFSTFERLLSPPEAKP